MIHGQFRNCETGFQHCVFWAGGGGGKGTFSTMWRSMPPLMVPATQDRVG